jgi:quinol monooxygenase YgiN
MYGYLGSMRARPGHRDDVVAILTKSGDGLRSAGCELYLVGLDQDDPHRIWVTEMWRSKQHHDDSLELPESKEAIATAMPMLTGEFEGHELEFIGGLGLPGSAA